MYCPYCLNNSLKLAPKGVAQVYINKKQMDKNRFLFNQGTQSDEEILENFTKTLRDFLQWYSQLKNSESIRQVEVVSANFQCSNRCALKVNDQFSIVDILIPQEEVKKVVKAVAEKYAIPVDFLK